MKLVRGPDGLPLTDVESFCEEFQTSPISMTSFYVIFSLSVSNFLSTSIDLVIDVCYLNGSTFEVF